MKKRLAKINFKLKTPLSISNGKNNVSDKDLNRNAKGEPYISGSSLAGVYLNLLSRVSDELVAKYFGYTGDHALKEGTLIFYDANLTSSYTTVIRDRVGLDEYKVAKTGAKFDFEAVNPGAEFVTYIEQTVNDGDENIIDFLVDNTNKITLGADTTRGLGRIKVTDSKIIEFDLSNDNDLNEYLDFDMYSEWKRNTVKPSYSIKLGEVTKRFEIDLKLVSPISIRVYSTNVGEEDYGQMTFDGKAIIPGSSWAGAFRHHMSNVTSKDTVDSCFGADNSDRHKSNISFSESVIEGAKAKTVNRNAIDRFSGGTVENALFTEKVYYGGTTKLTIELENDNPDLLNALAVSLADLNEGFMSLGGETGIGHGLFKILSINGKKLDSQGIYNYVSGKEDK